MRFETERLTLRPLDASDRDAYVDMFEAGAAVERWLPPMPEGDAFDAHFARQLPSQTDQSVRLAGVTRGGELAALVNLTEIVRGVFQNAYVGWRTHPRLLGQGYATEAVRGCLELAFRPQPQGLGLHRIQANILPDNLASRRVAERCGMREEGVARRYLLIRGEWRDHVMYARTAEE